MSLPRVLEQQNNHKKKNKKKTGAQEAVQKQFRRLTWRTATQKFKTVQYRGPTASGDGVETTGGNTGGG